MRNERLLPPEQQINKKQQTRNKKHKNKDLYCKDERRRGDRSRFGDPPQSGSFGCDGDGAGVKEHAADRREVERPTANTSCVDGDRCGAAVPASAFAPDRGQHQPQGTVLRNMW